MARQSKYCPVTALVTNHAAAPHRRAFHAHGVAAVRSGERSESENSSKPGAGANFGHRCCRIWPTICYSDDKDRISYADADDFKEFESDFDRISRRSQSTFTQLRRSTQWRADRGGWRRQYSSISCLLWTNKTRRRLLWLRVKRKRHTERGGGGRRGNRETSHGHTT